MRHNYCILCQKKNGINQNILNRLNRSSISHKDSFYVGFENTGRYCQDSSKFENGTIYFLFRPFLKINMKIKEEFFEFQTNFKYMIVVPRYSSELCIYRATVSIEHKYANLVTEEEDLELPSIEASFNNEFGGESINSENQNRPVLKVNDGHWVSDTMLKSMAYLRVYDYSIGREKECTGVLIAMRHILTAGHCVIKDKILLRYVIIGSRHRRKSETGDHHVFKVTNGKYVYNTAEDIDIEVLKLDRRVWPSIGTPIQVSSADINDGDVVIPAGFSTGVPRFGIHEVVSCTRFNA